MDKKDHVLSVPIYNLEISDNIGGEFRLEQVYFISSRKIPRIRKRLGLPHRISYYNNSFNANKNLFIKADVYAFIKTNRIEKQGAIREFTQIKDAVYLLASSQFYRERRHRKILFGGPEFSQNLIDEVLLFDTSSEKAKWNFKKITPNEPYRLDKHWQKHIKRHFFSQLLKVLDGKHNITTK